MLKEILLRANVLGNKQSRRIQDLLRMGFCLSQNFTVIVSFEALLFETPHLQGNYGYFDVMNWLFMFENGWILDTLTTDIWT